MTTLTNAELLSAQGRDLGASRWIRIEQARVDGFAEYTEDHQWIHVDPVRAAAGPFGTTVAHGFLVLSLVSHLLADVLHISDETRGINYGVDKIRFTNPVPVGAEIRLTAAVQSSELRKDGGVRCCLGITIEIRDVVRPALVGELVFLSYSN